MNSTFSFGRLGIKHSSRNLWESYFDQTIIFFHALYKNLTKLWLKRKNIVRFNVRKWGGDLSFYIIYVNIWSQPYICLPITFKKTNYEFKFWTNCQYLYEKPRSRVLMLNSSDTNICHCICILEGKWKVSSLWSVTGADTPASHNLKGKSSPLIPYIKCKIWNLKRVWKPLILRSQISNTTPAFEVSGLNFLVVSKKKTKKKQNFCL